MWDGGVAGPDVGDRDAEILGKGSGAVDTNAAGVWAEVAASCHAVAAATADQVAFATDKVAR